MGGGWYGEQVRGGRRADTGRRRVVGRRSQGGTGAGTAEVGMGGAPLRVGRDGDGGGGARASWYMATGSTGGEEEIWVSRAGEG